MNMAYPMICQLVEYMALLAPRSLLPVVMISCLSTSCVTRVDLVEVVRANAEKSRGPATESVWNAKGVWRRVGDNPATYIPASLSLFAPRGPADGAWVVDQRDGKRLFVPKDGAGGLSAAVLAADAKKVTHWTPRQLTETVPGFMVM